MKCGIVDVGSNTIRLSLYQYDEKNFRLLLNKKEMAGLAGYIKDGVLSPEGIAVACRILYGFRALLDNFDVFELYAFGTAALRNIANTEEALDIIRTATGLELEVLTGALEASLSYRGAAWGGGSSDGLLADIGGGSTELVAFDHGAVISGCSLPLGSLSLYTSFVDGLFPTRDERRALRAHVRSELEKARTKGLKRRELVGVGGTIRAALRLCNELEKNDPKNRVLTSSSVSGLYKFLKKGDKHVLRQILRCAPDRVHTIVPGLIIFNTVLKAYEVESIRVSACGVREGYLLERVMGVQAHG